MTRRVAGLLCTALLVLAASGCRERAKPAAGAQLTIAASTSCEKLARALVALYGDAFPNASAQVTVSNSRTAREAVTRGKADLALVAGAVTAESGEPGSDLESAPVARDGVAVIVAAANPVVELSRAQIRDVFAGQVLSWREIGGPDADIQTVSREAGSGTRDEFEAVLMGGRPVTTLALVLPGSTPVVDYVSRHSNAIAYVSTACLIPGVRALSLEGSTPDEDTIRSGAYPLTRLVSAVSRTGSDAAVQAFIDLAQSDEGQRVAEAAGYVGIR